VRAPALLLALVLGACSAEPPPAAPGLPVPAGAQQASVVRGVDGDTVVLRGRGSGPLPSAPTRVRVLLVDTPEVFGEQECFGEQAAERAAQLLPEGMSVRVLADRDRLDRFERTLLHVWTADGVNVGEALVREGFAEVLVLPPNRLYEDAFRAAEQQARSAGRGLWKACQRP
jgi:micrococcal nuclease